MNDLTKYLILAFVPITHISPVGWELAETHAPSPEATEQLITSLIRAAY